MASDILDRVAMVITDTGAPALAAVTANVLISDRFNTPQEAGAVDGKSYWWMLEEGVNYEIFEGVWTASGTKVARTLVWQSKINGVHGTTKMTLGGNATLRSITPAEALNFVRFDAAQSLTASEAKRARSNAGIDDRNVLINPDFRINQRGYTSGAAISAGNYMHDRWKAGAAGATYTFAQLPTSTQITITAGTILQIVEDRNAEAGSYVLSWSGTAQARAGLSSAAPSGAYASSPLFINGHTGGQLSVEFNTGTLGKVKLEAGAVPTPFASPEISAEIVKCMRYAEAISNGAIAGFTAFLASPSIARFGVTFKVSKRAAPTMIIVPSSINVNWQSGNNGGASAALTGASTIGAAIDLTVAGTPFTVGSPGSVGIPDGALLFNAEL